MNLVLRRLAFPLEAAICGPSYAVVRYYLRSPTPLDPEATWNYITRRLPPALNWIRLNYPPQWIRTLLVSKYLRAPHRVGIAKHYDVSNDFYELFLDKKYMLYSCADYHTGRETLEEAQTNKVQFIMNLLDPQPGERILELGCGWGGMLQEVFNRTGDRDNLTGYTLSEKQVEYNAQHRGFRVELKNFITDELPAETFDKIYSVGCWEHVRGRDLPRALKNLYGALKPGGRMVSHYFCPLTPGVSVAGVVAQNFFPGSIIPSYREQIRTAQDIGFHVLQQSLHDTYRNTLRHWFERLVAHREEAIRLVGLPIYNRYLVFFACSWKYFDDVQAMLLRIVVEKPTSAV